MAREFIAANYGEEYLAEGMTAKKDAKKIQDAHLENDRNKIPMLFMNCCLLAADQ